MQELLLVIVKGDDTLYAKNIRLVLLSLGIRICEAELTSLTTGWTEVAAASTVTLTLTPSLVIKVLIQPNALAHDSH